MLNKNPARLKGFTIVELLVVIVVIGILAAITIVTFNGLQKRAKTAELTSDLSTVARKFKLYHADHGTYPTSVDPSDSGIIYHLSVKNTSPQYFCVTGRKDDTSYYVQDSMAPAAGSCVGRSLDGEPLATNLAPNPSFETGTAYWNTVISGTTMKRITSGPGVVSGVAALEVNVAPVNQSGVQLVASSATQPSQTYTASGYVTLISGDPAGLLIRAGSSCGTQSYNMINGLTPNQPTRVSTTWTQCATATGITIQFWRSGSSTAPALVRVDAVMIEEGSSATAYSD